MRPDQMPPKTALPGPWWLLTHLTVNNIGCLAIFGEVLQIGAG